MSATSEPGRPAGRAVTVRGPVPVADLGLTLFHEHLHMDASPLLAVHGYQTDSDRPFDAEAAAEARWNPGSHPDNYRFTQDALVAAELGRFRDAGGRCVVEQTPPALGREPRALYRIATDSRVHVVMGTGHYLGPTHEPWVASASVDDIAARIVAEFREGASTSGIRPGIIGEVGTSIPVQAEELRVLRAMARAARETGLAVSVHLHPWGRTGHDVLEALLADGLAPERIVLGHLTTAGDDEVYLRGLADRGVGLAFDLFGFDHSLIGIGRWPPSDADVADTVVSLFRAGLGSQVFISHDIGVRTRLVAYGSWGYAHIPRHVVPLLLERGLTDADVAQLLVSNPARVLAVEGL
ncbi:phosphotriesterase-related protein [soil metagenome]